MKKTKAAYKHLIEVSYEIVAKLGGIHTVIKTKAPFMSEYYGDNYMVVGLYEEKTARIRFKRKKPDKWLKNVFKVLKKEGIVCHYGRWQVSSQPKAILIGIERLKRDKKLKVKISQDYWVNFLKKATMYNNSMLFGYAAGRLISEMIKDRKYKGKTAVNIHEYMCALTLFYLRKHKCDVPIVFTTHATALGRALAFKGMDLYNEVIASKKKNRYRYNKKIISYLNKLGSQIYNKHFQEKACARHADVFTAVSEVTSKEAGYLLDKKADVITPNGLEIVKYPSIEEQLFFNYKSKEKIYRFLEAYFKPYYKINEKKDCLFFYTAGRDEIYTKGYDLFFEALNRLNAQLKKEKFEKDIFVLLFIMLSGKKKRDIVLRAVSRRKKGRMVISKKNPPTFAFNVKNDKIISLYKKKNKLQNRRNDRVKVIFYPAPTFEEDKLLSMPYYRIISGMTLGIFPSLYEPWGYTPLETASMGTLTITTEAAGFGQFIEERSDQRKFPGVMVLKTKGKNREQVIKRLVEVMNEVVRLPKEKIIEKRIEANKLASLANWGSFSKQYIKAHNLAFKKHRLRKK